MCMENPVCLTNLLIKHSSVYWWPHNIWLDLHSSNGGRFWVTVSAFQPSSWCGKIGQQHPGQYIWKYSSTTWIKFMGRRIRSHTRWRNISRFFTFPRLRRFQSFASVFLGISSFFSFFVSERMRLQWVVWIKKNEENRERTRAQYNSWMCAQDSKTRLRLLLHAFSTCDCVTTFRLWKLEFS